ncbi:MAG: ferritin-like domain-containing protein, partial [Alphaproteobacteria bacterium]
LASVPTDKSAGDLVEMLVESNEKVARRIRRSVQAAEAVDDVYTADLLTARIGVHEKAAWMLRSLLAG